MNKKIIITFSILVAAAMLLMAFIYLYRFRVDSMVKQYINKTTICGNIIDEKECFNQDACEGVYSPSCPNCTDIKFLNCQRVAEQTSSQIKQEKEACQNSGGQWYRNRLGNFCLCDKVGPNKIFDKKYGCIDKVANQPAPKTK
jgi:hypothetical protein